MKLVTEANFADYKKGLTVALFTSEHCFPCQCMKRAMNKVEEGIKVKDLMEFINISSDKEDVLCGEHNVETIPTMIIFHEGKEVFRSEGAKASKQIKYNIVDTLQKLNISF